MPWKHFVAEFVALVVAIVVMVSAGFAEVLLIVFTPYKAAALDLFHLTFWAPLVATSVLLDVARRTLRP